MFNHQTGTDEEDPPILARGLAQRGLLSAAVIHDHSPVGAAYARYFEDARALEGIETTGVAAISPLAEDLHSVVARLREAGPDALVYLGLGVASRAVAVGLDDLDWVVPVAANYPLIVGYAPPEGRDRR